MQLKSLFLFFFLLISLVFSSISMAQSKLDRHRVWLKDKQGTTYSPLRPQEFLTPRSIARKQQFGIPVLNDDLPLSPLYLDKIKQLGGIIILKSKWFNTVVVQADSTILAKIKAQPFVTKTEPVSRTKKPRGSKAGTPFPRGVDYPKAENRYGEAYNQIAMLNGDKLHDIKVDGTGMLIAIMDGGFQNVEVMPFFDSIRAEGRLLATHDFIDGDDYVYDHSNHGTQVFSTIGANLPGLMIGTAPKASFVLLKTEDVNLEMPIEEDNWVAGLEYADSLGVDVINSSLGYTGFDDKTLNHTYKDLNGFTAFATRGANRAATKGILVCNSAGNEGGSAWKYIGVPADADSILSIAAVNAFGSRTYFSSYGLDDGRVKPNIAAKGGSTTVAALSGYKVGEADGTSFSSPVTAGMVAALWSGNKNYSNMEIMQAVQNAGSIADKPDNSLGYGIPDYYLAHQRLNGKRQNSLFDYYTNTENDFYLPLLGIDKTLHTELRMMDANGRLLSREKLDTKDNNAIHLAALRDLPTGIYRLYIINGDALSVVSIYHENNSGSFNQNPPLLKP